MSKKKPSARKGRGTKGPQNQLLPPELQGRRYRVCEFIVQPIILLYAEDGQEERRFPAPLTLTIFQSNFKKPLPDIMEANNLPMDGGKP